MFIKGIINQILKHYTENNNLIIGTIGQNHVQESPTIGNNSIYYMEYIGYISIIDMDVNSNVFDKYHPRSWFNTFIQYAPSDYIDKIECNDYDSNFHNYIHLWLPIKESIPEFLEKFPQYIKSDKKPTGTTLKKLKKYLNFMGENFINKSKY